MNIVVVIVAALSISGQLVSAELYKDETEDWKVDHYKLFGPDNGETRTPDEMLTILRHLDDLYQGRTGEGVQKRHVLVKDLIRMATPLTDPRTECNHKIMREYQEMKHMALPKHNLVPFVNYFRARRFEECRDRLVELEREKVASLNKEHVELVEKLAYIYGQAKREVDSRDYCTLSMILTMKRFMEQNVYSKKSMRDLKKFQLEAGQLIHLPCLTIRKNIGPMYIVYKDFEMPLKAKMDEFSRLWAHYDSVCISLIYGYTSLIKAAYKIKP